MILFVLLNSNTTGDTSGAGTAYPPGATEITEDFSGVQFTQYYKFIFLCSVL